MEAIIGKILSDLGTFLFGPIMLAVFFGVGLYFTIRLKGIQFTRFGTAFREVLLRGKRQHRRRGLCDRRGRARRDLLDVDRRAGRYGH